MLDTRYLSRCSCELALPIPSLPLRCGAVFFLWRLAIPSLCFLFFFSCVRLFVCCLHPSSQQRAAQGSVKAVLFRDANVFASAGRDGDIMIWDRRTETQPNQFGMPEHRPVAELHLAHAVRPAIAQTHTQTYAHTHSHAQPHAQTHARTQSAHVAGSNLVFTVLAACW
jgi:hypothetical protein